MPNVLTGAWTTGELTNIEQWFQDFPNEHKTCWGCGQNDWSWNPYALAMPAALGGALGAVIRQTVAAHVCNYCGNSQHYDVSKNTYL